MRRTALLVLSVAALAAAPLGCGEDGSGSGPPANPRALLERAFDGSVRSARVRVQLEIELAGASPLSGPVTAELEGPYVGDGSGFPRFDWQGSAGVLGFDVDAELVSLGDNLLVIVYGEGYEVGTAEFAALSERLSGLRVTPGELVGAIRYVDREEVDGTETFHLAAGIDPSRVEARLRPLGESLGLSRPPTGSGELEAWIGVDDGLPRRLAVDLSFPVAPEDRASVAGTRRADLLAVVELSELNRPQALPKRPRGIYQPLPELFESLGGLAGLAG